MVQLLAPYIDHESHSAQRHRQTDDRHHAYANSRSYCVAVRSAKNPHHNPLGQYANSPGHGAYCYAELAVFFASDRRNHQLSSTHCVDPHRNEQSEYQGRIPAIHLSIDVNRF